jgi:hypothetical protein
MRSGRAPKLVVVTALVALALGGAGTATAHNIDIRQATEMTRDRATALGSVAWAVCWRKPAAIHVRLPRRAVCMASVETASSGPCLVIYEVRAARKSGRAVFVAKSGAPRCVNQPAGASSGSNAPPQAKLALHR